MWAQQTIHTHIYLYKNAYTRALAKIFQLKMIIFTKTFCGTGMRLIVCGVLFSVVTVRRCKFFRYTIYDLRYNWYQTIVFFLVFRFQFRLCCNDLSLMQLQLLLLLQLRICCKGREKSNQKKIHSQYIRKNVYYIYLYMLLIFRVGG